MDVLLWITISFITIGIIFLFAMKKNMERRVDYIKTNPEDERNSSHAKVVILWIWSAAAWGVVSMILVNKCFQNYFG